MKRTQTLAWALALVVSGSIGLGAVFLYGGAVSPLGRFTSDGQRIYYTGASDRGAIPRSIAGPGMMGRGMMAAAACVDCHGEDGRGGRVGMMFGSLEIPDIRYSTLSSPREEDGALVRAWTDREIARAIREGVEPDGEVLRSPMPRWDMTDAEVDSVIAYLKELSAR